MVTTIGPEPEARTTYCSNCGDIIDFSDVFGFLVFENITTDEYSYFCKGCFRYLASTFISHDWKTGRRYPK